MNTDSLYELMERQKKVSSARFGDRNGMGALEHLKLEIAEIIEKPEDHFEWADAMMLLLDAAWRFGVSSSDITEAMNKKYAINDDRQWPDWRNYAKDEPITHIKPSELLCENAKFKKGDILRKGNGLTALMRVDSTRFHGGSIYYYGRHCMGGSIGAYEEDCTLASEKDIEIFRDNL